MLLEPSRATIVRENLIPHKACAGKHLNYIIVNEYRSQLNVITH